MCARCVSRTSGKKAGKKFKVVFVPIKTLHCINRFSVSGVSCVVAASVHSEGGGGDGCTCCALTWRLSVSPHTYTISIVNTSTCPLQCNGIIV